MYCNEKIVDIIPLKQNRFIALTNKINGSSLKIYNNNYSKGNLITDKSFGNKIIKFDFDELSRNIAFYSVKDKEAKLVVYFITEDLFTIKNEYEIDLTNRYGINEVKCFRIDGIKKLAWIIDECNVIRKIFFRTVTCQKINKSFDDRIYQIQTAFKLLQSPILFQ